MALPYVGEIILAGFNFAPVGYAACDGQFMAISQNETLFQLIGTTYGGDGETTFRLPDLQGRVPIGIGQGSSGSNYALGESGGVESVTLTVPQVPVHTHIIDRSAMTATVRVRNAVGNLASPVGNVFAIPTSPPFTDPTLTPGTSPVRAVHITQLRARITTYRGSLGLAPFSYTDATLTPGTTPARAAHILELRTSLQQAYVQAGLTPPVYTDPALSSGTQIKAVHIAEIRAAVQAVPSTPAYGSGTPGSNMNAGAITLAGGSTAATGGSQPHENRQPYLAVNYCIALEGIFPPVS